MRASSRGERNGLAGCATNQQDLFDHSVIAHAEAKTLVLCASPAVEIKRRIMLAREAKGLEIVTNSTVAREGNVWVVPSQSSSKKYTVSLFLQTCTCPDFEEHRQKCKHIHAAEYALQRESGIQTPAAPEKQRITYRQEWPAYNLAQTNEKARLQELLYELCKGVDEPVQTFGRPRLSFAEMIFAAAFKVYSTISSRRFISDLREAQQRGYITKTPHFNSISNYLELESMTPYLKQLIGESSLPLKAVECDFAADSSGFATGQFSRWFDAKYGEEKQQHDWLKVHVMCGVKTNVVTSVEVSGRHANDSPYFKPLLETTSRNGFQIKEVSADKGYDSFNNRCLVLIKGGIPYIPFREGEQRQPDPSNKGELWKRMYHFYKFNEAEFKQHYHKRSNVETVFSMIKAKFGERLRSKTETSQINEALCKILCHNVCCLIQSIYELGIEPTFWEES